MKGGRAEDSDVFFNAKEGKPMFVYMADFPFMIGEGDLSWVAVELLFLAASSKKRSIWYNQTCNLGGPVVAS
jgi:hypothetical protein